jgi:hypothetical protein
MERVEKGSFLLCERKGFACLLIALFKINGQNQTLKRKEEQIRNLRLFSVLIGKTHFNFLLSGIHCSILFGHGCANTHVCVVSSLIMAESTVMDS